MAAAGHGLEPAARVPQGSAPVATNVTATSSAAPAGQQHEPWPGTQSNMQASDNPQQATAACQRSGSPDNEVDAVTKQLSLLLPGQGAVPSAKPAQESCKAAAATDQGALAGALLQPRLQDEACSSSRVEEQRALRCLVEIFCEAAAGSKGWDGAVPAEHAGGARRHAADSSSPFPPGSMAQWLYTRMGSNPTVAMLLRSLLCPFIKVSPVLCGAMNTRAA